MTSIPFADRPPTAAEVERVRLLLSTFQDGSGMLATTNGRTLPGWRDFERSVALALNGEAPESKAIFDVVLTAPSAESRPKYGLSCKMRSELDRVDRDGRVTIEVSNASGEFWKAIESDGLSKETYANKAEIAGNSLLRVLSGWHKHVSLPGGGSFDVEKSSYLVLLWNKRLDYQLFQYPLKLFDSESLAWHVPKNRKNPKTDSRRLCASDGKGNLIEWYGFSGGQLKFYPFASTAIWKSERFRLEPLPKETSAVLEKAQRYFPTKWVVA